MSRKLSRSGLKHRPGGMILANANEGDPSDRASASKCVFFRAAGDMSSQDEDECRQLSGTKCMAPSIGSSQHDNPSVLGVRFRAFHRYVPMTNPIPRAAPQASAVQSKNSHERPVRGWVSSSKAA